MGIGGSCTDIENWTVGVRSRNLPWHCSLHGQQLSDRISMRARCHAAPRTSAILKLYCRRVACRYAAIYPTDTVINGMWQIVAASNVGKVLFERDGTASRHVPRLLCDQSCVPHL